MNLTLRESDLLLLSDLNLVDFWCQSAKWVPHPEIVHKDDSVFINSVMEFPACSFMYNLSHRNDESPGAFLERAKTFFKNRKKAFSLQLRAHVDRDIISHCKEANMFLVGESPGMVLDEPVTLSAPPEEATIQWVDDEKGLADFMTVVMEAYQDLAFPEDVSERYFMLHDRVLAPHVILCVVYHKGHPASAAMAMLSHGIAGLYWVGTRKEARGLGLARCCVEAVGNMAFDMGARKVVLQASRFGKPVYLKIGYREFTRYPWFICSSS